eukprot:COSAG04_NODE_67_length_29431_cov_17.894313_18_plen_282_part_00
MEELDLVVRRLRLLNGDVKVIRLCQLALAVGHWRNNQVAAAFNSWRAALPWLRQERGEAEAARAKAEKEARAAEAARRQAEELQKKAEEEAARVQAAEEAEAAEAARESQEFEQAQKLFGEEKFADAKQAFLSAIDKGVPEVSRCHVGVGLCSVRLAETAEDQLPDLESAVASFDRALELAPGNESAWHNRVYVANLIRTKQQEAQANAQAGSQTRVVALHDFSDERDGFISMQAGDTIVVVERTEPEGWWTGFVETESGPGTQGLFPSNFIRATLPRDVS